MLSHDNTVNMYIVVYAYVNVSMVQIIGVVRVQHPTKLNEALLPKERRSGCPHPDTNLHTIKMQTIII